jgi:protoporphyrinogen oxidase
MPSPGGEAAELLAWPQGNGRLVEHLAAAVGPRRRTGHLVVSVENREGHAVALVFDAARGELVRYEAERVIMATPKFLARRLIRGLPAGWAEGFTYGAWMVANLHLDGHPHGPGAPIAWDNVLIDSPSLGYVVATHQAHRDEGPTILTYYYPYTDTDADAGRRRLYQADHAQIADMVLADLGPAHRRLAAQVERLDVFRWGHAMAQPRVGFVWGPERRRVAQPVGRVHLAHSDLSGLALFEEALHHGIRAAEEVFVALDPGRTQGLIRLG